MITHLDGLIWRGPRPIAANFEDIKKYYQSVISLEGLDEDIKEQSELDPVKVFGFPISPLEIYVLGISQLDLSNILDCIKIAPKPLLIHCQHGEDRTGLVCAAYRVRMNGWSKDEAWAEAKEMGYRWYINYGLNATWRGLRG